MLELNVKFVKRLFGDPEGDYSVFSAKTVDSDGARKVSPGRQGTFTIAGNYSLDDSEIESIVRVTIEEDYKSRYPNSYKIVKIHYEFPSDPKLQWEYLENSNIIPTRIVGNIKETFKASDKILDIITETPEQLQMVKGIGEERANLYCRKILSNKDKALLFSEYGDIDGVGSNLIKKMVNMNPKVEETIKAIKKDPFVLIERLGVGFVLADKFRDHYDFPIDDKNRVLHGVSYYLQESFRSTGNTYEGILNSSKEVAMKLMVSYQYVISLLAEIKDSQESLEKYKLKIFGKNITTESLYQAERAIYQKMSEYSKKDSFIKDENEWNKIKSSYLNKLEQALSDEQDEFLSLINKKQVTVLLGPGGAGKSWVINIACELIKGAGKTYGLFAPTARAANVMKDYVGSEAKTIHRGLLPYSLSAESAPFDVLIVDEFSMVDSELASVILDAMAKNTRLIIVGDSFQLQSVGPGNVLFDLVEYIQVPTVRLTKIFRQSKGSKILDYAQALRDGNFSIDNEQEIIDEGDVVFINESNDEAKQEIAMKLYSEALSKIDGNYDEIMLLSPLNKGKAGKRILNKRAQEITNPGGNGRNEVVFGGRMTNEDEKRYFRKNDFITVTKNEYDMIDDEDEVAQIINGDLGHISSATNNSVTFEVDEHSYTISKSEITDLLDHAWVITIHKSQGGQANDVIIVLPENSYFMLNANMLYTALTRAKVRCYFIGNFKEINKAAERQANYTRKTMIQLQSELRKSRSSK